MKSSPDSLRPRRSVAARCLFALSAGLLLATPAQSESAEAGSRRVLEISVPSIRDDLYARQAALALPHWRGLLERDLDIVTREGAKVFRVRLIGKDGGEKLLSASPVTMPELFALIDTMPMRREEMKRGRE